MIERQPDFPAARLGMAQARIAQGRLSESRVEALRAVRWAGSNAKLLTIVAGMLSDLGALDEAVDALKNRLPAVLAGRDEAADWREALAFAEMALMEGKDPAGALKLYRQAFEENPAVEADPRAGARYNAACAASRVGEAEHAQALAWLRADLVALEQRPRQDAGAIVQVLTHWKADPDLAPLRDADDLPEAFQHLWADVDALLERAQKAPPR